VGFFLVIDGLFFCCLSTMHGRLFVFSLPWANAFTSLGIRMIYGLSPIH
jgi:hypothetical protein